MNINGLFKENLPEDVPMKYAVHAGFASINEEESKPWILS
jgi:hypothetical protein